jgi:hypothetical protein
MPLLTHLNGDGIACRDGVAFHPSLAVGAHQTSRQRDKRQGYTDQQADQQ